MKIETKVIIREQMTLLTFTVYCFMHDSRLELQCFLMKLVFVNSCLYCFGYDNLINDFFYQHTKKNSELQLRP